MLDNSCLDQVLERLASVEGRQAAIESRLAAMEQQLARVEQLLTSQKVEKEWYTVAEVAAALGLSEYQVRQRWCGEGLIECEKDPATGRWRIPGREYRRLLAGGRPASKHCHKAR